MISRARSLQERMMYAELQQLLQPYTQIETSFWRCHCRYEMTSSWHYAGNALLYILSCWNTALEKFASRTLLGKLIIPCRSPNGNILNLSFTLLLVLSPKTPKFHHITLILKSLHWLKINERIKYIVLSLTYKSLKTGQPFYLLSLLSFPLHRFTRSTSLITLSCPSLTSRLKKANSSYYHFTPILWNNLPFHLRQVVHHVTPPILNSPESDLFLKKLKPISFTLSFLLSLYSPRLSRDWYLRYWPSFVFSSHIHFAIIHRHVIHANFNYISLVSIYEFNLFNFLRHFKSPPFHSVIRIRLISLSYHILVILPSHFCSMEQMLMLYAGVKNMAKAYISHPGSSKRLSMQNVERGHKECVQVIKVVFLWVGCQSRIDPQLFNLSVKLYSHTRHYFPDYRSTELEQFVSRNSRTTYQHSSNQCVSGIYIYIYIYISDGQLATLESGRSYNIGHNQIDLATSVNTALHTYTHWEILYHNNN